MLYSLDRVLRKGGDSAFLRISTRAGRPEDENLEAVPYQDSTSPVSTLTRSQCALAVAKSAVRYCVTSRPETGHGLGFIVKAWDNV